MRCLRRVPPPELSRLTQLAMLYLDYNFGGPFPDAAAVQSADIRWGAAGRAD